MKKLGKKVMKTGNTIKAHMYCMCNSCGCYCNCWGDESASHSSFYSSQSSSSSSSYYSRVN
ncbi:CLI_3235 family bacteriocin precursor [Vallitalea guaymasensis]|uniref:CLI_3235 family bacteriocin n=1 Tax=Vallitalea guaymasensis TaxID=1185412 RepID=A0A8J8MAN4_9FIRM|nr:CLI_3235 family bacteriocin precursor [Vallitalea guaymasensis]QUH29447.1 CLI_3235 family bacteriocin precursor [Vallitalea guaymasensis]